MGKEFHVRAVHAQDSLPSNRVSSTSSNYLGRPDNSFHDVTGRVPSREGARVELKLTNWSDDVFQIGLTMSGKPLARTSSELR